MKSNEKRVKNYLLDFGLSEKEIILYLTLLRSGPTTVMSLSRATEIKRSTAHNTVDELINKGLISQTNYGERRLVIAESPEKLKFLLEQKKWEMKKLEDNIPEMVKIIKESVPEHRENTEVEVRYYHGEKGFKEVCQRSLMKSKDEILFLSNYDEWSKIYTIEYDKNHYIPTRIKNQLHLKLLTFESEQTIEMKKDENHYNREIRFLNKKFLFPSTIIIYGCEVSIMFSSKPYTAILIESYEITESFKKIFYGLWEFAKLKIVNEKVDI